MSKILEIKGLGVRYGAVVAVEDLNFDVSCGEAVLLFGPNGAGKTSTLKAITGLADISAGTVQIRGVDARGRDARWFMQRGIVLVPEGARSFGSLTVRENLLLPARALGKRDSSKKIEEVFALFPVLGERRSQRAGTLSGGEQKMLAIGRGLMTSPDVLCIDEPTLGLAPAIINRIAEALAALISQEIGVVIVEQRLSFARLFEGRVMLLERGVTTWVGESRDVIDSSHAQAALLGRGLIHGSGSS